MSEHILDTAYNKDKLGIDKTDNQKVNDDQHTSGSMTKTVTLAEESAPKNGTLNAGEVHQFANSELDHVTNAQTFDTIFPGNQKLIIHSSIFTSLHQQRSPCSFNVNDIDQISL